VADRKGTKAARLADAIAKIRALRDDVATVLEEIDAIRNEYEEWWDAMSEGWQEGEKGQAVREVADCDTDADSAFGELDTMLDTIEQAVEATHG
jgi:hypothetical protein